jgi:hypothetical protein
MMYSGRARCSHDFQRGLAEQAGASGRQAPPHQQPDWKFLAKPLTRSFNVGLRFLAATGPASSACLR